MEDFRPRWCYAHSWDCPEGRCPSNCAGLSLRILNNSVTGRYPTRVGHTIFLVETEPSLIVGHWGTAWGNDKLEIIRVWRGWFHKHFKYSLSRSGDLGGPKPCLWPHPVRRRRCDQRGSLAGLAGKSFLIFARRSVYGKCRWCRCEQHFGIMNAALLVRHGWVKAFSCLKHTCTAVWFWAKRVKSFLHRGSWKLNESQRTFVTARPKAAYIVRAILQIRSAASACPEPKPLGSERLQTSTDAVAMHGNT